MTTTIDKQLRELSTAFERVDTLPVRYASRLGQIMDEASEDALVLIVRERVKFCHMLARVRLHRTYGWSWDAINEIGKENN